MDDVKQIQDLIAIKDLLEMHCMFRMDAWDCDECNSMKCAECLAKHLVGHGVTVQKRGHWIIKSNGKGANATNWAECSECHVCGSPQWKVCPVCETKMDGKENT